MNTSASHKPKMAPIGVLLLQTGTPGDLSTRAVRGFLREFLSDRRVVPLPRWFWLPLLYGVILPLRSRAALRRYEAIWTSSGSPLWVYTDQFCAEIERELNHQNRFFRVVVGFRYGKSAIAAGIESLERQGCRKILLFPLFPQYSSAASGSAIAEALRLISNWTVIPQIRLVEAYAGDPMYLKVVAAQINNHLVQLPALPERLLLSYHGLPKVAAGTELYEQMCQVTSQGIRPLLKMSAGSILHTYQSRYGRGEWLGPDTVAVLRELAEQGVSRVSVAFPGFAADCLETLMEIGIEAREEFVRAGGKEFSIVPCLNADNDWVKAAAELVRAEARDWGVEEEDSCV